MIRSLQVHFPERLSSWVSCLWLCPRGNDHLRTFFFFAGYNPVGPTRESSTGRQNQAMEKCCWGQQQKPGWRMCVEDLIQEILVFWSTAENLDSKKKKKKKKKRDGVSRKSKVERDHEDGTCLSPSQRASSRPHMYVKPGAYPSGCCSTVEQMVLAHTKSGCFCISAPCWIQAR